MASRFFREAPFLHRSYRLAKQMDGMKIQVCRNRRAGSLKKVIDLAEIAHVLCANINYYNQWILVPAKKLTYSVSALWVENEECFVIGVCALKQD